MTIELFLISLLAASSLLALGILDLSRKDFIFWPPPEKNSWQDKTFIWLFRGLIYPLLILSVFEFRSIDQPLLQYGLGGLLLTFGFGTAFASTFNLGWKNAFGDKEGLVTNGWFAYSRNPVYVVTWIGQLGWATIAQSNLVSILLALWGLLYLLAIFLEEAWLERTYGEEYLAYKISVRRFF